MIDAKLKAEGIGDEDNSTHPERGTVVYLMAALKKNFGNTDPNANAKPAQKPDEEGGISAWSGSLAGTQTRLIREWQIGQPTLQRDDKPVLVFAKLAV
jgi:hypothetical protein